MPLPYRIQALLPGLAVSGAVALAALLAGKVAAMPGTLVILSGGNTDAASFAAALAPESARVAEPA